jgi:hypothetical protein
MVGVRLRFGVGQKSTNRRFQRCVPLPDIATVAHVVSVGGCLLDEGKNKAQKYLENLIPKGQAFDPQSPLAEGGGSTRFL